MHQLQVKTNRRCQLLDVTGDVADLVGAHGADAAAVLIHVPHTTAGILINENADPSVPSDILKHLEEMVPQSGGYQHSEGNSDAHIKSTLTGVSLLVPITNGKMALGTWQGIFFAEFDGPRTRKLHVSFLS
jgi:secondary thiamine-phosphate synthase enzyme